MGLLTSLPIFKSDDTVLTLMQNKWSSQLNVILALPILNGTELKNIALSGQTVINHKLGRKMQGYIITDLDTSAIVYRSASFNDTTLVLTTSTPCLVTLWVY